MIIATGAADDSGFPFPVVDVPPHATSPEAVVRFLIADLASNGQLSAEHVEPLVTKVLRREELGSTAIGRGIATPHAKSDLVDQVVSHIGRLAVPVEWRSVDGEPVRLVCMVIAPAIGPASTLRHLESMVRRLRGHHD